MGMFDYVRSEVALPDGFTGELQSKDFDCAMTIVLIRADGRLLIEDSDWEEVPANERPYPDPSDPMHWIGSMRTVNRRWRDLNYHGMINFYGDEGRHGTPEYRWHEYQAKFTDGKLIEITVDPDGTSPSPKNIAAQEMER